MSFKKFTTSAVVAASLIAASLSPLATAAHAGDGWRKHNDRGYSRSYDGRRDRYRDRYSDYRRHDRRDHNGKNVAKGVAIGLGILAVGAILASEAHR